MNEQGIKILHVMNARLVPSTKFAIFVQEKFSNEHYFCPYGPKEKVLYYKKVLNNCVRDTIVYDKNDYLASLLSIFKLVKVLKRYDVIIWHSFFCSYLVLFYLLLFHKYIIKKSIWMEWGGDLYEPNIKSGLIRVLYKKLINTLFGVILIFKGDNEFLIKNYAFDGHIYYGCYGPPSAYGMDLSKLNTSSQMFKNKTITIQIGHSASDNLNHFKCLDLISRFKNQDIKIVLPINYGDMNYAEKVKEYAKSIFEDKQLMILDKLVPLDEYNKILDSVDVCIVDASRQIALGNLLYFLGQNKSIYLNKNGIMYKCWKDIGLIVRSLDDINTIYDATDLVFQCNNASTEYVQHKYDDSYYLDIWVDIFNKIKTDFYNKFG